MAARPVVFEVAVRPQDLVARRDIEPAVAVSAGYDIGAEIRVRRRVRVPEVRPLVVELSAAHFEERLVAHDGIPFQFVGVGPVQLVPRRIDAVVDGGRGPYEKGVEAVRLRLARPLAVPHELIVRTE